jgi:hypothetical protein
VRGAGASPTSPDVSLHTPPPVPDYGLPPAGWLLSKEERALLDSLAEVGDAAKLTRRELHDMATSPELARHLQAAEAAEARLVQQLYREGRPLYDVLRPASPSFKSKAFARRESRPRRGD